MKENLMYSYSAANTFPLKVLLHPKLKVDSGSILKIKPLHVQLNPTNHCNFNCDFCSCSSRDRALEVSREEIFRWMESARSLGCEATTITGGGEPLLHKNISDIVTDLHSLDIQVGLVSNGVLLKRLDALALESLIWIRLSASDLLPQQLAKVGKTVKDWLETISVRCNQSTVDWAFSYVIGEQPNFKLIKTLINFATSHEFTHVRLVNDILQADTLSNQMEQTKKYMQENHVDDSQVNYQSRTLYTKGMNPCFISLLKPVIGADGFLYPCCGTQYALANPSKDYEPSMRMGYAEDLPLLIKEQKFFNGSQCVKCYYSQYNEALQVMTEGLKHSRFV